MGRDEGGIAVDHIIVVAQQAPHETSKRETSFPIDKMRRFQK